MIKNENIQVTKAIRKIRWIGSSNPRNFFGIYFDYDFDDLDWHI